MLMKVLNKCIWVILLICFCNIWSGKTVQAENVELTGKDKVVEKIELASDKTLYHPYELGGTSTYQLDGFYENGGYKGNLKVWYKDGTFEYDTYFDESTRYDVAKDDNGNWIPGKYKGYIEYKGVSTSFDIEVFHIQEKGIMLEQGRTDVNTVGSSTNLTPQNYYCFTVSQSGTYALDFSKVTGKGYLSLYKKNKRICHEWINTNKTMLIDLDKEEQYFLEINRDGAEDFSFQLTLDTLINMQEDIVVNQEMMISTKGLYQYIPAESGYYKIQTSYESGENILGYCYEDKQQDYKIFRDNQIYLKAGVSYWFKIIIGNETDNLTLKQMKNVEENNVIVAGVIGNDISWKLDNENCLNVQGTGELEENPWSNFEDNIKEIAIGEGIISVGDYLYDGYRNVKNLKLPDSLEKIGKSSFYGIGIEQLTIPKNVQVIGDWGFCGSYFKTVIFESDTALKKIGQFAFANNSNLISISIPSSVEYIGPWAFSNIDSGGIKEINYTGENLKYLGQYAFWTEWLANQKDSAILGKAFVNYKGEAEELVVPNEVTLIGVRCFKGASTLKKITLSNDTQGILEYGFEDCTNLQEITIPGSVSKVSYQAFFGCSALEEVVIEDGVQELGHSLFSGCYNLKKITIPKSVTKIGEDLKYSDVTKGHERIGISSPEAVIYCYTNSAAHLYAEEFDLNYWLLDGDNSKKDIAEAEISLEFTEKTYTGETMVPELEVIYGTKKLKRDRDYTVDYDNNLNAGIATVLIMGEGRYTGTVKKTFKIQPCSIAGASVTLDQLVYVYDGSSKMPTITLGLNNIVLKEGQDYQVIYENNILPGTATVKISGIGNYIGTIEKEYTIQKAKTGTGNTTTLERSFTDASRVSVILNNMEMTYTGQPSKPIVSVSFDGAMLTENVDYVIAYKNNINVGTAVVVITGMGKFSGSVSKEFKVVLRKGAVISDGTNEYVVMNKGEAAFSKAGKKEKKIIIPATIKVGGKKLKVTAIANKAFYNSGVTSVSIGNNIKSIGTKAFYNCKKLKSITIKTTKLTSKSIGSKAFKGVSQKATIKVPGSKMNTYKKLLRKKGLGKKAYLKKK